MSLPSAEGASPAMAQWFALKAQHPDALLFFRMGDFFELFFSDAEAAAAALDIALTTRGTHAGQPITMCGVPVAAGNAYLARLIRRGFRVAIAEQTEKPSARSGKQPLARAIVRLVTAGTLTEDELLEAGRANLLLAVVEGGAGWIDISTGRFATAATGADALADLIARLDPAEIIAPPGLALPEGSQATAVPPPPAPSVARARLAEALGVASIDAFGEFSDAQAQAGWLALDYVRTSQAGATPRLDAPRSEAQAGTLGLDPATRASLDLLRARDGGDDHTLFAAIDRTLSGSGGRLLGSWIAAPLTDRAAIVARQEAWGWLLREPGRAAMLRGALRAAPDIERALARLSLGRGLPRDLAAIRDGLAACASCAAALEEAADAPAMIAALHGALSLAPGLRETLERALAERLPARLEDGGVIAPGFDGELDAERRLCSDSRALIAGLQNDYAQTFGIASLKLRHHAQLGYVIEVAASQAERLRGHPELILRQGTAALARFATAELADLDRRIAEAGGRAAERERGVFAALVAQILAERDLPAAAWALAALDALQSAASLAQGGDWCRPEITDGADFAIEALRHPVVERALARAGGGARFAPNDCDLSPERSVLLLTGPNMAGKSTYLRQCALAVILAQAGLPLPARSARIGIVDRLFSRVGAADDLARGRSTFMVEMTETAAILNQGTSRSLVVVDEIGRGTATLDGLAIAWAVLEALHGTLRCRAIFATHFHELADLADSLPRLRPHTMKVREWRGEVVFLHEVVEGRAGRSWGVHVAKLAGVPAPVVARAGRLLASLERQAGTRPAALPLFEAASLVTDDGEITCSVQATDVAELPQGGVDRQDEALREALGAIDCDTLSPREALEALYRLRAMLG